MPALNNSPPPDASTSQRGLVNIAAQSFEGVKTFAKRIVATLGITAGAAMLELSSSLGANSGEIATKLGTTVADGTVHAAAKLLSLRTGIGGTEVEKIYFSKSGALVGDGGMTSSLGSSIISINEVTLRLSRGASAVSMNEGGGGTAQVYNGNYGLEIGSSSARYYGPAAGASDVSVKIGTQTADASVHASAKLLSIQTGLYGTPVEKAYFTSAGGLVALGPSTLSGFNCGNSSSFTGGANVSLVGNGVLTLGSSTGNLGRIQNWIGAATASPTVPAFEIEQKNGSLDTGDLLLRVADNGVGKLHLTVDGLLSLPGSDSSASPGAATINKGSGISAIANGASSVVITNSIATTASKILITWHADHGATRTWVTRAAGSFTVNLSSAATANAAFSWEVSSLL